MDGYGSLINDDEEGTVKGDPNDEEHQVLTDYPEIYDTIDNIDEEMAANFYDQYIGDEVVLPDQKCEELMGKVRNRIKYDDIRTV